MELDELYRRTLDTWTGLVRAVPDDRWDAPTPCTEWSVRELVNHVVGEDLWTAPLMRGSTLEEVGDRFDGDLLGDDPRAAAVAAADEAGAVVAETLPDRPIVHLSYGDEQGEEYVRQLAADHLIHAWDLAVATGSDDRLDPEQVAAVAAWFAEREDVYRSAGVIGPRGTSSGDAQGDLLAGFGRDAGWRQDG